MKIENQVTSLELSKKLKSLGVKQESLFYWAQSEFENEKPELTLYRSQKEFDERDGMGKLVGVWSHGDIEIGSFIETYSAFTVAELGEMLPESIVIADETFYFLQNKEFVTYHNLNDDDADIWSEIDDTEANARAKMLIYLLENKIITNPTAGNKK